MQPYLFPYIGYFQLINAADKFVILDDVNFINRGWINRNNILVNGKAHLFTLPLENSGQNRQIKDIEILQNTDRKKKFLKTIDLSYRNAPYFKEINNLVSEIILFDEKNISKYICFSLVKLNEYLDIKTEIVESSSVYLNDSMKNQERIIDICKKENAHHYINPIGGKELYSKELFKSNGITLNFIKSKKIEYKQFENMFVDSLSIIDVLMFNPKDKVRQYLNEYELI